MSTHPCTPPWCTPEDENRARRPGLRSGSRIPGPGSLVPGPHFLSRRLQGFTLVEALVSLVVLTVLLALALPLVIESLRLLEETGRRAQQQERELALAWLRRDLEHGSYVGLCLDTWGEARVVVRRDGVVLEWRVDDGILVRHQRRAGSPPTRRPFLGGIEQMRVRCLQRIVEVELAGRGGSGPAIRALTGGLRPLSAERSWREHVVVATGRSNRWGWW